MSMKYKDDFDDFDDFDMLDDKNNMNDEKTNQSASSAPSCPPQPIVDPCAPCNKTVGACCFTTIPASFGTLAQPLREPLRLVYDVSCLSCVVNECTVAVTNPAGCPGPSQLDVFQVRIVGCIPFMASVDLQTQACGGQSSAGVVAPTGDKKVSICCQGSVCVDNPICIKGTKCEAQAVCDELNVRFRNKDCSVITNRNVRAQIANQCSLNSAIKVVELRAEFILPECPNPWVPVPS